MSMNHAMLPLLSAFMWGVTAKYIYMEVTEFETLIDPSQHKFIYNTP